MAVATGLETMLDFVSVNSPVRFDRYMGEHLFSRGRGFYDQTAVIGKNGHFMTYSESPAFAYLVHMAVRSQGLSGKDFLEIGGGSGHFKQFYLQHSPATRYISVDASQNLARLQANVGGETFVERAESMHFADGSINGVIFANELLDAFSCRVFRIENDGKKVHIGSEGYVVAKDGCLAFTYLPAERDNFLLLYESFLQNSRPDIKNDSVICASPILPKAISEMARVMGQGKIILPDYGFWDDPSMARQGVSHDLPFFTIDGQHRSIEDALGNPYATDIMYLIDFEFAKWIAGRMGLQAQLSNIGDYFKTFTRMNSGDVKVLKDMGVYVHASELMDSTSQVVLEITKQ